jgi:hypothetical protein
MTETVWLVRKHDRSNPRTAELVKATPKQLQIRKNRSRYVERFRRMGDAGLIGRTAYEIAFDTRLAALQHLHGRALSAEHFHENAAREAREAAAALAIEIESEER